jgi:hypothetical protein
LDEVSESGGAEAGGEGHGSFFGDYLTHASDETTVVL